MTGAHSSKVRVLIVDDMPQVRQDLRTVLPLAGSACGVALEIVGEAANGLEAVRLAQALRPDVVLMDLGMPVMDGCAATRQIKAAGPEIRVIALTVHGEAETREEARRAGIDGYILKGEPVDEILRAVAACMDRRREWMGGGQACCSQ